MQFSGEVIHHKVGAGSKSEHTAVVLLTSEGPLKLRRASGNPFHDAELEKLVGRKIVAEGQVHQGQLLLASWQLHPGDQRLLTASGSLR
jgi:hypothetical protein